MMPAFAHWLFSLKTTRRFYRVALNFLLISSGIVVLWWSAWAGIVLILLGANNIIGNLAGQQKLPSGKVNAFFTQYHHRMTIAIVTIAVSWLLAQEWMPLGVANSLLLNFLFIALIIGLVLGGFRLFIRYYPSILHWCLENQKLFLLLPALIIVLGINIWLGFDKVLGFITQMTDKTGWNIRTNSL
jgi:Cu(I)/Ag(I) efflux system membrane protein CusA/SilA